jgi:hypothetical protein
VVNDYENSTATKKSIGNQSVASVSSLQLASNDLELQGKGLKTYELDDSQRARAVNLAQNLLTKLPLGLDRHI